MRTVLFVCAGNTCRSPMAACLFNSLCQKDGETELRALSAGTDAMSNMCASDGARRAMEKRGLSLDGHLSRRVTAEMIKDAETVMCVGPRQRELLSAYYPWAREKLRCFDPPIPDPYGGSAALYEQTAADMEPQIAALYQLLILLCREEHR